MDAVEAVVVWWWQWRRVGHLAEARAQLSLGLEVGVQRAVEEGEHLQRGWGSWRRVEVAVVEEEAAVEVAVMVMAAVAARRHLRLVLLELRVLPFAESHLDSLLHRLGRTHLAC